MGFPAYTRQFLFTLLTVVVLFASGTTNAAGETNSSPFRAMTPMDVATMQYVSDVAISPDGSTVAFVRRSGRTPAKDKNGSSRSHLGVLKQDGTLRIYIGGEQSVSSIQFTPNGKEIAFLAKRGEDKKTSLYTIPVDGGEAMKVAAHPSGIRAYSFHPDGKQVALLAKPLPNKDKEAMTKKGFNARVRYESVEPTKIWLVKVAAREGEMAKPIEIPVQGSVSTVSWSPEGAELVITKAPTALTDDHYMFRKVHVVNVDKMKVTSTLEGEGKIGKVLWSPDSVRVAVLKGENINDPSDGRLMVAPAKGGTLEDVAPSLTDGDIADFAWLSSSEIIAMVHKGTETGVFRIHVDQKTMKELIPFGKGAMSRLSLSKVGGRMAFSNHRADHPSELYTWNPETGLERRTHHNKWLRDVAMGKQEVIRFKARDGVELEGILIHPVNRRKNQKVPLILHAHGGPESHYTNGWLTYYSWMGQMAAGKGYAVFYPNYRGSTGRGVAFSKTSQGDPAGREFDDLVDAVDHLVSMGLVHKSKVGIAGGSYGGYASAWAATYYSNRFAASIPFVGVTDLISKFGTTDIQYEMYHVHYGFWPWEKWDELLLRSPIYYANQSRTPTLILHGEGDKRVDPGQARELYHHLRLRGKAPVRLVTYPGEGHGNSKAASRYDASTRMLRWFDHFLVKGKKAAPDYDIDYKAKLDSKSSNNP